MTLNLYRKNIRKRDLYLHKMLEVNTERLTKQMYKEQGKRRLSMKNCWHDEIKQDLKEFSGRTSNQQNFKK